MEPREWAEADFSVCRRRGVTPAEVPNGGAEGIGKPNASFRINMAKRIHADPSPKVNRAVELLTESSVAGTTRRLTCAALRAVMAP